MAVGGAEHPRRRWLDALFGEAFARERRRHLRQLLVALLVGAAAAAVAVGLRLGGGASPGLGSHVTISSSPLPLRGDYRQLTAVGDRLIVTSGTPGYSLVDGRGTGTCRSWTLDPLTLRVTTSSRGSCEDPSLYGRRVLPVTYIDNRSGPTGLTLAVRIATSDRRARDGYRLGPVVLTFSQCSDCQINWIYGDGSLWLYSPLGTGLSERAGELFRISDTSGRVLQRWSMPVFLRALLAVNRDGLWLSQSLYSGMPGHIPESQRADYRSIYLVAPGAAAPVRARQLGSLGAYWMVAAGQSVWVDESNLSGPSRLWLLRGSRARAVIGGRPVREGSACGQFGEGAPTVAGSTAAGIFCLDPNGRAIRGFDPSSGAARSYAVPNASAGPAVSLGRSVYLLSAGRHSRIYRVGSTPA